MEKNIKSAQTVKNSKTRQEQTRAKNSVATEEKNAIHELYNSIKSALHGESDQIKLCQWQLPPNSDKAGCTPINCIDQLG